MSSVFIESIVGIGTSFSLGHRSPTLGSRGHKYDIAQTSEDPGTVRIQGHRDKIWLVVEMTVPRVCGGRR
jgi:hypothetical protein